MRCVVLLAAAVLGIAACTSSQFPKPDQNRRAQINARLGIEYLRQGELRESPRQNRKSAEAGRTQSWSAFRRRAAVRAHGRDRSR